MHRFFLKPLFTFFLVITVQCYFPGNAIAQSHNAATTLKKQADIMAAEFSKGNFSSFIKYTHPKVIKMIGGEASMLSILSKQVEKWKEEGIMIQSVTIGEAGEIFKAGTELHALIPQSIVLKVPRGKMVSNTHLLAISPDKGTNWFFIDSSPLSKENLKKMFPNYNEQLVIPAKKEPVFTPDE